MIIYGGFCNNEFTNDIWSINLQTFVWRKLYSTKNLISEGYSTESSQLEPEPRSDFSMVVYMDNLYIFAGKNLSKSFSDFWKFDLKTNSFTKLPSGVPGEKEELRSGHSAVIHSDYMIVFGGLSSVTH